MKAIWTIVALLLLGGLIALLQPPAAERDALSPPAFDDPAPAPAPAKPIDAPAPPPAEEPKPSPTDAATAPEPAPPTAPTEPVAVAIATPAPVPAPLPPTGDKPKPTEEKPVDPKLLEGASEFTPEIPAVANAEILPSKFLRLPDGSISADDAWTIRGEGTAERPYEVSWEFLSSAQDSYVPRLGESKIPARIAFLSGKQVKISGYLAFPLVAPTASECLAMLNQWDGCCIGIPPTPYDAIEVRLATEIKGWKRHTLNFGSIEGRLVVDPHLVENWLVGLYLMEEARIDAEL